MTRRWPYHFPMGTKDGYKLSPIDKVMRSDMEVGAPRVRKTTTENIDRLNIAWRFTDVQMAAFRAWFDDLPWSLGGSSDGLGLSVANLVTISAGPVSGPEGQASDRMIETVVSGVHMSRRFLSLPDNTDVQFTATVRAAGRGIVRFQIYRKDGVGAHVNINLSTGVGTGNTLLLQRFAVEDRGNGWWSVTVWANIGSGGVTPEARIILTTDGTTITYAGDAVSGVDVTDFQVRAVTGYDLFLPTGTTGNANGANGGSAWFSMPVALGNGGVERREVRFIGTFAVSALPGFNWEVSANLEVRNA